MRETPTIDYDADILHLHSPAIEIIAAFSSPTDGVGFLPKKQAVGNSHPVYGASVPNDFGRIMLQSSIFSMDRNP